MDKLEEEIARLREETAALKKKAEAKEVELRTLVRAASLRPIQPSKDQLQDDEPEDAPPRGVAAKRGGRQEGALSKFWRLVLENMYAGGQPVPVRTIVSMGSVLGNDSLQEGSVRARMRHYATVGYVSEHDGAYQVTDLAAKRFDFKKSAPLSEGS